MLIDNIKKAIDLINDKTVPFLKKVMVFVVVIIVFVAVEFLAKTTYNYHLNNKLKQLDYIASIRSNSPSDSVLVYLEGIEIEILNKSHYSEGLYNTYLSLSDKISQIRTEPSQQNKNTTPKLSTFLVLLFLFGFPIIIILYGLTRIFISKSFSFKRSIAPTILSFIAIITLVLASNYFANNIFVYSKGLTYLILFICQSIITVLVLYPPKED